MTKHRWLLLLIFLTTLHYDSFAQKKAGFTSVPGRVIAHSPATSKKYIGSPSICILPNGDYVASHDYFGKGSTEHERAVSRIYKSANKGKSWKQIAEINGQFWSNLFVHNNVLYLMGTYSHYGNLIIRRSLDGGVTWTEPSDENNGLIRSGRYHTAPMPVILHNGRLWRAVEVATGDRKSWAKMFDVTMFSIPEDADLMKASNWQNTTPVPYDSTLLSGAFGGWLEGNALVSPEGRVVNMLRTATRVRGMENVSIFSISEDGKTAAINPSEDIIPFPGGTKKFTIRFDPVSGRYWTLSNYIPDGPDTATHETDKVRNTLALSSSRDLRQWTVHAIVLHHPDREHHAFQYVDWQFDGKDLIVASRTAFADGLGGAHRQHDANFLTFHRIKKFRKLERKTIRQTLPPQVAAKTLAAQHIFKSE